MAKVKKEYNWKVLTKKRRELICTYLRAEVKVYDDYITGNVWGYTVEDKDGEEIDSCWGFIGSSDDEYMISQAKAAADADLNKTGEQTELTLA